MAASETEEMTTEEGQVLENPHIGLSTMAWEILGGLGAVTQEGTAWRREGTQLRCDATESDFCYCCSL